MSLARGIYLIWDHQAAAGIDPETFLKACSPQRPVAIQLRAKGISTCPEPLLQRLISACSKREIPLIINDHEDWLRPGCQGLHLGQEDGPSPRLSGLMLGRSTHNLEQVAQAARDPFVDHLGFGPIAATHSKSNALAPRGIDSLEAVVAEAGDKPLVAIGGIGLEQIPQLRRQGVHAAAVIAAVFGSEQPTKAFQSLCEAWG